MPENTSRLATQLTESEAAAEARRIIAAAYAPDMTEPIQTRYRDTNPVPEYGPTPPVQLPDNRAVPAWAAGVAVASIGAGCGVFAIGGGVWLILEGLSSVTLMGVLAILAPFAGLAALATAIGAAVAKGRSGSSTHIYQAPVTKQTEVTTNTRGLFSRTRNELHD